MCISDSERARRRARQMRWNSPVTSQGVAISVRHMRILGALKRIERVTAHTPYQRTAHEAVNFIIDALKEVDEIILEMELAQ